MTRFIEMFDSYSIDFSWNELKIGRFGYKDKLFQLPIQLDDDDVIGYTTDYLSKTNDEANDYIWKLVGLTLPVDANDEYNLLELISGNEGDKIAYFKWRWILVTELLDKLDKENPLEGLLQIVDFWLSLDMPFDMPFQFQGMGNNMDPIEFYSQENFNNVLANHKKWLEDGRLDLQFD